MWSGDPSLMFSQFDARADEARSNPLIAMAMGLRKSEGVQLARSYRTSSIEAGPRGDTEPSPTPAKSVDGVWLDRIAVSSRRARQPSCPQVDPGL
jgi:hypothetical protein